jgi:hypothetical protein
MCQRSAPLLGHGRNLLRRLDVGHRQIRNPRIEVGAQHDCATPSFDRLQLLCADPAAPGVQRPACRGEPAERQRARIGFCGTQGCTSLMRFTRISVRVRLCSHATILLNRRGRLSHGAASFCTQRPVSCGMVARSNRIRWAWDSTRIPPHFPGRFRRSVTPLRLPEPSIGVTRIVNQLAVPAGIERVRFHVRMAPRHSRLLPIGVVRPAGDEQRLWPRKR